MASKEKVPEELKKILKEEGLTPEEALEATKAHVKRLERLDSQLVAARTEVEAIVGVALETVDLSRYLPGLQGLLYDVLGRLTVTVSEPYGYSGTVFNRGDHAWVKVTIRNGRFGKTLRDVVARLHVSGGAKVDPLSSPYDKISDAVGSWDILKPGVSERYYVRIYATSSEDAYLRACVSAEIVPYSRRCFPGRTVDITPA